MNTSVYFFMDLEELKNCKTELSINSHIKNFDTAYFYEESRHFLKDYIKTIGNLAFLENGSKSNYLMDFRRNLQNIKVFFIVSKIFTELNCF